MQIQDSYPLHPGQCHICTSNRTPVFDTGRDLTPFDPDGRLYICVECVLGMAFEVGAVSAEKHQEVVEAAQSIAEDRDLQRRRADQYKGTLERMHHAGIRVGKNKGPATFDADLTDLDALEAVK